MYELISAGFATHNGRKFPTVIDAMDFADELVEICGQFAVITRISDGAHVYTRSPTLRNYSVKELLERLDKADDQ